MDTNKKHIFILVVVAVVAGLAILVSQSASKDDNSALTKVEHIDKSKAVKTENSNEGGVANTAVNGFDIARGTVVSVSKENIKIKTNAGDEKELKLGEVYSVFYIKDGKPTKGDASLLAPEKKINIQYNVESNTAVSMLIE